MTNLALKLRDEDYDRLDILPGVKPSRVACLSNIATIIDRVQNGHISLLVGDDQANGGAILFAPGQMATPDAISFMASRGRGLICLALTAERVEALGLELLPHVGVARSNARFTVSIEASTGVTTGISAFDRARTIAVAISTTCTREDLVTPGHVFPLVATSGGTLSHPGHAEAVVDLARLAGLNASGVFCALLNERGEIAGAADIAAFAEEHGLPVGSISDLIRYRLSHDRDVLRVKSTYCIDGRGDRWEARVYRHSKTSVEALALLSDAPWPKSVPLYIDYRSSCAGLPASLYGEDAIRPLSTKRTLRSGSLAILLDRKFSDDDMPLGLMTDVRKDVPALQRDQSLMCAQILADLEVTDFDIVEGSAVTAADFAEYGPKISCTAGKSRP